MTPPPRDLAERSLQFSKQLVQFVEHEQRRRVLSARTLDQLLRAGTAIGAHNAEADAAITRRHLLALRAGALKEARETEYWLEVVAAAGRSHSPAAVTELQQQASQLTAIPVRGDGRRDRQRAGHVAAGQRAHGRASAGAQARTRGPGPVRVFYEAGPCGYALQRQITTPPHRVNPYAPIRERVHPTPPFLPPLTPPLIPLLPPPFALLTCSPLPPASAATAGSSRESPSRPSGVGR